MGSKGRAGVVRGTEEAVAPYIGSRSLAESMDSAKVRQKTEMDKAQQKLLSEIAIAVQDGHGDKVRNRMTRLVKNFYKGDLNAAESAINAQLNSGKLPAILRSYMDEYGMQTPEQESAFIRDNMGNYLDKRYGGK